MTPAIAKDAEKPLHIVAYEFMEAMSKYVEHIIAVFKNRFVQYALQV